MRLHDWKERGGAGKFTCNVRTRQFDNFPELLDFIASRPEGSAADGNRSSLALGDRNGWRGGTQNMGDALNLARFGWPEGREIVEAITARFESITASKLMRPQVAYAVAGDCVDVGRYVTGEPENMMVWEEVELENAGKIVRVEANLSASAAISAAQMTIRGAAVAALVDALEQCGKSVELVLSWGAEGGRRRIEHYCPIKAAGEPLDMDRLAFMLAHAGMFRRLAFGTWENEPGEWRDPIGVNRHDNYGLPAQCKGGDFVADITAPHMLLTSTPEACVAWVFKTLKEQGISVDGI